MVFALTIHLLAFTLIGVAIDRVFLRWLSHPGVHAFSALAFGVFLLAGRLAWLAMPIFNPFPPLEVPLAMSHRNIEFWWGWVLILGLIFIGLWGLARLWWACKQLRVFVEENPLAGLEVGCAAFFLAHRIRIHLEREYRQYAAAPRLSLRFSWLTESPVLTGTVSPKLVLPMGLLEEHEAAFLEPILDHEAEHIRFRHHWIYTPLAWTARCFPLFTDMVGSIGRAMVLRVDRAIRNRADGETWKAYENAIRGRMTKRIEWSPALAPPHCTREAEERIRQANQPSPRGVLWPCGLLAGLFLSGITSSTALGHVSIHTIKDFLMHNQIKGYHYRLFDPRVTLHGLPDKGGVVPDGVVIDTGQASGEYDISSFQVNLRSALPPGTQAARISCDYEAVRLSGAQEDPPTVSSRVMERLFDKSGQREDFWVFDFRWKPLPEGQGRVYLDLRLKNQVPKLPSATSHLWGPDVGVPAGWRLIVTNWSVEPLDPDNVPPTDFPAEAEGFISWYQRHKHQSRIHLDW